MAGVRVWEIVWRSGVGYNRGWHTQWPLLLILTVLSLCSFVFMSCYSVNIKRSVSARRFLVWHRFRRSYWKRWVKFNLSTWHNQSFFHFGIGVSNVRRCETLFDSVNMTFLDIILISESKYQRNIHNTLSTIHGEIKLPVANKTFYRSGVSYLYVGD